MSVQHEYRGTGDPNGVVVAPVNSHYVDELTYEVWLCNWSDGTDSSWIRVAENIDVFRMSSGSWDIASASKGDVLVEAGTVLIFTLHGSVYTNVELGAGRTYTVPSDSYVQLNPVYQGGVVAIITPITEYPVPL